jgi:hypothetical protein
VCVKVFLYGLNPLANANVINHVCFQGLELSLGPQPGIMPSINLHLFDLPDIAPVAGPSPAATPALPPPNTAVPTSLVPSLPAVGVMAPPATPPSSSSSVALAPPGPTMLPSLPDTSSLSGNSVLLPPPTETAMLPPISPKAQNEEPPLYNAAATTEATISR